MLISWQKIKEISFKKIHQNETKPKDSFNLKLWKEIYFLLLNMPCSSLIEFFSVVSLSFVLLLCIKNFKSHFHSHKFISTLDGLSTKKIYWWTQASVDAKIHITHVKTLFRVSFSTPFSLKLSTIKKKFGNSILFDESIACIDHCISLFNNRIFSHLELNNWRNSSLNREFLFHYYFELIERNT